MTRKILVVYYTQSGQLKKIIDNVLSPLNEKEFSITYERIQPVDDYPFPWGDKFFNCFPESVKLIPCGLKPFGFDKKESYDLVILACQSWYLSPSIPFNSFLQSEEASHLLKGKNIITIHGVRNMWVSSQEIVKKKIKEIGGNLVGNIVLGDRNDNYVAGFTIIRWLVSGKKEPYGIFPAAGVSEKDISESKKFGEIIKNALEIGNYENLQKDLIKKGAVKVKYNLMMIEKNARRIFNKFASFILKKGGPSNPDRSFRIKLFKWYLLFVFFIVSPFASVFFITLRIIFYPFLSRKIEYYRGIE